MKSKRSWASSTHLVKKQIVIEDRAEASTGVARESEVLDLYPAKCSQ